MHIEQTKALADAGALFVANHSGGKDSQVLLIKLLEIVPASQILVVHATLGDMEWPGALELAKEQAEAAGVAFVVTGSRTKTLLTMVEHRFTVRPSAPSWPSASNRQCTSDLKRAPIERAIRGYAKEHGFKKIVNCMGLRAQESSSRAKLEVFKRHERNSVAGRDWYDWLPVHKMTVVEVFATIAAAGQKPHWAYEAGNERLSCVFCIMGSQKDLRNGAKHNPALLERYIALEKRTGYTMHMSRKSLTEIIGAAADITGSTGEEPCDAV